MAESGFAPAAPKYGAHLEAIKEFLQKHRDSSSGTYKYREVLQEIADRNCRVLNIHLDDLDNSELGLASELVDGVLSNTCRYVDLFAQAADAVMPPAREAALREEDPIDVLLSHRAVAAEHQQGENSNAFQDAQQRRMNQIPPELKRRYEVRFQPPSKQKTNPLRLVRAHHIGHLLKIEGIVTRITEVKPMLKVATYVCDSCGCEIYQETTGKQFMPVDTCPSVQCQTNQVNGRLFPQTRGSKFVKYQELKLQELASQVPVGHVPRTLTVHVTGEQTRRCNAGDVVTITGVFLPEVLTGYRGLRSGLTANTFVEAMSIERQLEHFDESVIDEETIQLFKQVQEEGNIYNRIAKSLAPEIYGHDDVKKSLLLQLVGAAPRTLPDGMKIRGDINVLLVGDPGVAKSQLLKHIAQLSPRGVYTTGKGSSGVGLTAAVLRDPLTSELVLEGGALVLADMGICCIDEFDKMGDEDRTSIHEVMEQQTVSIAKAGITTTLNARTSVLAAANPFYGRYNESKKISENINLPTSLISRFDIVFLLLDRADEAHDLELARHVTYVHRHSEPPPLDFEPLQPPMLRKFIAQARRMTPHIPAALTEHIVEQYVSMRAGEAGASAQDRSVTARSLLSILRTSQALARLRFADSVEQADVDEAMRLMDAAKASVMNNDNDHREQEEKPVYAIYEMIVDLSRRKRDGVVAVDDVREKAFLKGFTDAQLQECLDMYTEINVFQLTDRGENIVIVSDV